MHAGLLWWFMTLSIMFKLNKKILRQNQHDESEITEHSNTENNYVQTKSNQRE